MKLAATQIHLTRPATDVRIGETLPPLSDDLSAWKPPGRLMHGYEHEGAKYEVWCASLSDSRAVEIFEAGQLLIPLFIDGGTRQQLNDPPWTMERWTVFFLYFYTTHAPAQPAGCLLGPC